MQWRYKEKTLGVAGLWKTLPTPSKMQCVRHARSQPMGISHTVAPPRAHTSHKEAGVPSLHGSLSTSAAHTNAHGHMDATLCCNTDPTHRRSGPWAHGDCNASHFSLGDCNASPCDKKSPWAALPVGRSAHGPRTCPGLNAGGTATPLVASLISARSGHPGCIGSKSA